jgi:hypothetical protein
MSYRYRSAGLAVAKVRRLVTSARKADVVSTGVGRVPAVGRS